MAKSIKRRRPNKVRSKKVSTTNKRFSFPNATSLAIQITSSAQRLENAQRQEIPYFIIGLPEEILIEKNQVKWKHWYMVFEASHKLGGQKCPPCEFQPKGRTTIEGGYTLL
jgi:hypothetical protein